MSLLRFLFCYFGREVDFIILICENVGCIWNELYFVISNRKGCCLINDVKIGYKLFRYLRK